LSAHLGGEPTSSSADPGGHHGARAAAETSAAPTAPPVLAAERRTQAGELFTSVRMMRPAKVRSALRRRWFEYRIPRAALREAPGLVDLGSPYGGWTIPGGLIQPSWVCYCVGIGGDITFDLELIRRYGVRVRAFDPISDFVDDARDRAGDQPGFSAHQAAIHTSDGPLRMQVTHHVASRSVSSAGLYDSHDFIELPGRTLRSLMDELGDDRIDLLKLDLEGGEYDVVRTLDPRALGVKILAIQLHHSRSVRAARALIAHLHQDGYEPVAVRSVVKVTFVHDSLLRP
jgi:FkbM family methyltransferase